MRTLPSHLRRITVSRKFWAETHKAFPGLDLDVAYKCLFWYLLFGRWHDRDTHQLLLHTRLLCQFEGKSISNNHGGEFLSRFKHYVLPTDCLFEWSRWDPRKEKCRRLTALHLGAFEDILQQEYQCRWHHLGRVYLDGTPFSEARQAEFRRERERKSQIYPVQCPDAAEIRRYLHRVDPSLFTWIVTANYSRAVEAARELGQPASTEQMRLLLGINSDPKPFYSGSKYGNTVRLFASDSIPNLQKDVRRALTRGWFEADLRCSQLAICARLWNVEEVQAFLQQPGMNFWSFIMKELAVPFEAQPTIKPIIKTALYSICFGMKEGHVKGTTARDLVKNGQDKRFATLFVEHPLLRSLLAARELALEGISKDGGAETCFGKWIGLDADRDAPKVMAEVAQAWEMKLIFPAFQLARRTPDFTITLFQHDGFSVCFRDNLSYWIEKINRSIRRAASEQGFHTELEWKQC